MSTNGSPSKKRKQDSQDNEGQGAVKSVKLEVNNDTDGAGSDGSDSGSEDESLSSVPTPKKISPSLPPLVTSPASRNLNGGVPAPLPSTHQQRSLPRPGIPPQQNTWTLELHTGTTFDQLLSTFSTDHLPDKITYNGSGHNVHKAFEEFWSGFYNSDVYSKGNFTKLPITEDLREAQAIARIVKRGWEDCHYFPNRMFQPFLEACIFNREDLGVEVSENMFLEYIEPSDKELLLENQESIVTEEIVEVLKRYLNRQENEVMTERVKIGDSIKVACSKVVKIMLKTLNGIIQVWTREVVGLLEFEEFKFIMIRPNFEDNGVWNDMDDSERAPHKRWSTFFYDWNQELIDYYFQTLRNDIVSSRCNFCGVDGNFRAKHFISNCEPSYATLLKERHDCVLRIIHRELESAIARKHPYFCEGDWKTIVMYGNLRYEWPNGLEMLNDTGKYPHLIAYTLYPTKKALIIEPTVSWEFWMNDTREQKINAYISVKRKLEEFGFQAQLEIIVFGSRGVATEDLYSLFENAFGMSQPKISRAMEKICKKIVSAPYFYNTAMQNF